MEIYYKNNRLFPCRSAEYLTPEIYRSFNAFQFEGCLGTKASYFDFKTSEKHTLNTKYDNETYKLVYCFKGKSQTFRKARHIYSFNENKALFYHAEPEESISLIPGITHFKILHLDINQTLIDEYKPFLPKERILSFPIPSDIKHIFNLTNNAFSSELTPLLIEKLVLDGLYAGIESDLQIKDNQKLRMLLNNAIDYIDSSRCFVTIKELSKITGSNAFMLKKAFHELKGTGVLEYQINQKLDKALFLIKSTDYPISEIAFLCGYESVGSFSNSFFKKFGIRPSAIKNSRLNN